MKTLLVTGIAFFSCVAVFADETVVAPAVKNAIEFNGLVGDSYVNEKKAIMEVTTYGVRTDQGIDCRFQAIQNAGQKWDGLWLRFRSPFLDDGQALNPVFAETLDFDRKTSTPKEIKFFVRFTRGNMVFETWARMVPRVSENNCEADAQVPNSSGQWEKVENVVASIHRVRHLRQRHKPVREIDDIDRLSVGTGRSPQSFREVIFKTN